MSGENGAKPESLICLPPNGESRRWSVRTGPGGEEDALRERARAAVVSGRLPGRAPDTTFGGRGSGFDCSVCAASLAADELEIETEFADDEGHAERTIHRFHVRCFLAWEIAIQTVHGAARPHLEPAEAPAEPPTAVRTNGIEGP